MFNLSKKRVTSLEAQIKKLSELGIYLNSDITIKSLLEEHSEEEYQKDPYQLLLIIMGGEIQNNDDDEFKVVSDQIWHLDTECIADHGDYITVIDRLRRMTKLDIHNIKDYVDIEQEQAWVSFDYNNGHFKWELTIDADWLDVEIFSKFNLLVKDKVKRSLSIAVLGQDCLIGFFDEEQLREINKLVKYKFERQS